MARFLKDRIETKGLSPGSLIFIGKQKMERPIISLIQYNADDLLEKELYSIDEIDPTARTDLVFWVNINGIHDMGVMQQIGDIFGLPPLLLKDILNTDQRPKYEYGDNFDAFILKMLKYNVAKKRITAEQFTLILGPHFVITFQEQSGDVFKAVRDRIRKAKGRNRLNDSDYLAYTLLDTIVDNYILIIETLGGQIEELEEKLFSHPNRPLIEEIYTLKIEISYVRKAVRPVKELMGHLLKRKNSLIQEKYRHFLKDLDDLVLEATDAIELYSGMLSDHLHIYSTNVSNRSNEVMKVLTIFASIFIPLTFITGIYGMNFEHFPELQYRYSYLIFWIVVICIAFGLMIYFRRKKWL